MAVNRNVPDQSLRPLPEGLNRLLLIDPARVCGPAGA